MQTYTLDLEQPTSGEDFLQPFKKGFILCELMSETPSSRGPYWQNYHIRVRWLCLTCHHPHPVQELHYESKVRRDSDLITQGLGLTTKESTNEMTCPHCQTPISYHDYDYLWVGVRTTPLVLTLIEPATAESLQAFRFSKAIQSTINPMTSAYEINRHGVDLILNPSTLTLDPITLDDSTALRRYLYVDGEKPKGRVQKDGVWKSTPAGSIFVELTSTFGSYHDWFFIPECPNEPNYLETIGLARWAQTFLLSGNHYHTLRSLEHYPAFLTAHPSAITLTHEPNGQQLLTDLIKAEVSEGNQLLSQALLSPGNTMPEVLGISPELLTMLGEREWVTPKYCLAIKALNVTNGFTRAVYEALPENVSFMALLDSSKLMGQLLELHPYDLTELFAYLDRAWLSQALGLKQAIEFLLRYHQSYRLLQLPMIKPYPKQLAMASQSVQYQVSQQREALLDAQLKQQETNWETETEDYILRGVRDYADLTQLQARIGLVDWEYDAIKEQVVEGQRKLFVVIDKEVNTPAVFISWYSYSLHSVCLAQEFYSRQVSGSAISTLIQNWIEARIKEEGLQPNLPYEAA